MSKRLVRALVRSAFRVGLSLRPLTEERAVQFSRFTRARPGIFPPGWSDRLVELDDGVRMRLGIDDVIERSLRVRGEWDPLVGEVLRRMLRPGDVFFDVGANIGYFSLLASRLVSDAGVVVAFEPSARALSRLTFNLCASETTNVVVCSHALGSSTGVTRINWATPTNIGGSTIGRGDPFQGRTEPVTVCKLDDVVAETGFVPALIKIDVEGYESFVIKGAERTLIGCSPIIVCEITDEFLSDHGGSAQALLQRMESYGYGAWRLEFAEGIFRLASMFKKSIPKSQFEVLFARELPASLK